MQITQINCDMDAHIATVSGPRLLQGINEEQTKNSDKISSQLLDQCLAQTPKHDHPLFPALQC